MWGVGCGGCDRYAMGSLSFWCSLRRELPSLQEGSATAGPECAHVHTVAPQ